MKFVVALVFFFQLAYSFLHNNGRFISNTAISLFGNSEPAKTPAKKDGGMFGGMGNMMENIKKAQEIAKKAEQMNKDLVDTIIEGSDPTGQVKALFNGLGAPISVKVSDSILSQGSEAVSIAVSQAVV
jgi:DNA-binding protein YbaB